ncbi:MAG TPA: serine hydrolase, partial [Bacteroidales bacterium]|nr:serine hydrolase [Bacteroidales bacterium]
LMSDRGKGPACKSASASSYGHSGFTGTYFWVDPETKLVYVFICNRTYPVAENNKIISLNTRTKLHQAMYDAIITDTLIAP